MTMLHELKPPLEEAIEHYGVKGMKWGVRRNEKQLEKIRSKRSDDDILVKRGTEIHTITNREKFDPTAPVYVSHTNQDILNYRGDLALRRSIDDKGKFGEIPVFERTFTPNKDIKAPSEKKSVEAFKKIYDEDPEGVLRDLAAARKDMMVSAAIAHRVFKLDRDDVYYERLRKKGDVWIETKGADQFVRSFGTEASRESTSKKRYFSELSKQGFNSILDTNDTTNYGSEQPLLIFSGKTLGRDTTVPLSMTEIDNARRAYYTS